MLRLTGYYQVLNPHNLKKVTHMFVVSKVTTYHH